LGCCCGVWPMSELSALIDIYFHAIGQFGWSVFRGIPQPDDLFGAVSRMFIQRQVYRAFV